MKMIYEDGWLRFARLSEDETRFYQSLKDGIIVTQDAIRSVATCGDERHILELTANGINRIRIMERQPTIPIPTDDGRLCCDACGCGIEEGQTSCNGCGREIDWSK